MSEDHDSTPISELDESASLNANDEFIISTKDSNDVYSSKKVKLSTVQNASPAAGITVKEEGTTLTTNATSLNFVGSTVTASGTGAEKTITITEPAGGGGEGGASWSSGWLAVGASGAGTTKILTHNLGTTDVVFAVYAADDSSGTGASQVTDDAQAHDNGSWSFIGSQIRNITNNQIYLQLGTHYHIWTSTPSQSSWNGKFFKVVATAGGGGGSGMKYSGAESTVPLTTSWADLNLSNHVGSNRAYVMMKVWGGQPATQFTIKPKDEVLNPCYPNDAGARGTVGIYLLGDGSGCGAIVSVITDENGFVSVQGNVETTTDVSWKILCYQVLS